MVAERHGVSYCVNRAQERIPQRRKWAWGSQGLCEADRSSGKVITMLEEEAVHQ